MGATAVGRTKLLLTLAVCAVLLCGAATAETPASQVGDESDPENYEDEDSDYSYEEEDDDMLDVDDDSESDNEDPEDDTQDSEPGPEATAIVNVPDSDTAKYNTPAVDGAVFLATFQGDWRSSWTSSGASKYNGVWEVGTGKVAYIPGDKGLIVPQKARHYGIAAHVKDLDVSSFVLQYETRFDAGLTCSGAYLKLPTAELDDLASFDDSATYSVMFGPDKCGGTSKVHFIFQSLNPTTGKFTEHHLKSPPPTPASTDKGKTHLFTLIITNVLDFEILINGESKSKGSLAEDFEPPVQPPAEIPDPDDTKPEDWVDAKKIPDPDVSKPEDWDEDAPKEIPDESAEKPEGWLDDELDMVPDPNAEEPEDWDTEEDGEWAPAMVANEKCEDVGCGEWKRPMIPNEAYKGPWKAPMIDNPDYKGPWKPRDIPNKDFYQVDQVKLLPIKAIGVEVWVMDHGILFDNILISKTAESAKSFADSTWAVKEATREAEDAKNAEKATSKKSRSGKSDGLEAKLNNVLEYVRDASPAGLEPIMDKLVDLGVAKPALVASFVPLFIVLLMLTCLMGRKTRDIDAAAVAKKTDAPTEDDVADAGSESVGTSEVVDGKDGASGVRRRKAE